jgi:hypothetical protein
MDAVRGSVARMRRAVPDTRILVGLILSSSVATTSMAEVNYWTNEHAASTAKAASAASVRNVQPIALTAYMGEASAETTAEVVEAPYGCDDDSACECYSCQCGHRDYGIFNCLNCPIRSTDHCYDCFISPMTNPVYFEDPRNLTEARVIFLQHKVPLAAGGGDIQLYALQIRAALTERLSLIAAKDGFMVSSNPLIEDGWGDIAAGLKYLIYSDPCSQTLLSGGAVYEAQFGSSRSHQGNGNGTFDLFLSAGTQLCCNGHWIGGGGFVLPADDTDESTWCYISNHFDYYLGRGFYVLNEYNWYHYLESGAGGVPGVEGGDLFNFGSTGVAGNSIVSGAIGMKYKPNCNTEVGVAWEVPLTERRDVLENRLTVDYIYRF